MPWAVRDKARAVRRVGTEIEKRILLVLVFGYLAQWKKSTVCDLKSEELDGLSMVAGEQVFI